MAIKNLFGRGAGFGAPHWIVTHGFASGNAPPPVFTVSELVGDVLDLTPDVSCTALFFDPVASLLTPAVIASDRTPGVLVIEEAI